MPKPKNTPHNIFKSWQSVGVYVLLPHGKDYTKDPTYELVMKTGCENGWIVILRRFKS